MNRTLKENIFHSIAVKTASVGHIYLFVSPSATWIVTSVLFAIHCFFNDYCRHFPLSPSLAMNPCRLKLLRANGIKVDTTVYIKRERESHCFEWTKEKWPLEYVNKPGLLETFHNGFCCYQFFEINFQCNGLHFVRSTIEDFQSKYGKIYRTRVYDNFPQHNVCVTHFKRLNWIINKTSTIILWSLNCIIHSNIITVLDNKYVL